MFMNEYKMCALYDTVAGLFRPDDNKHQTKGLYPIEQNMS